MTSDNMYRVVGMDSHPFGPVGRSFPVVRDAVDNSYHIQERIKNLTFNHEEYLQYVLEQRITEFLVSLPWVHDGIVVYAEKIFLDRLPTDLAYRHWDWREFQHGKFVACASAPLVEMSMNCWALWYLKTAQDLRTLGETEQAKRDLICARYSAKYPELLHEIDFIESNLKQCQ